MHEVLKRMSGEELLLLRILNGESVQAAIDLELDRRASGGPGRPGRIEEFWAGRNHAARRSARLAA